MKSLFLLAAFLIVGAAKAQADTIPLNSQAPVFESSEMLQLQLDADLDGLFSQVRRLLDQGNTEAAKKVNVVGTLRYIEPTSGRESALSVNVEVKGNSSLSVDECIFPKLKIKFKKDNLPTDGLFGGVKKFSINSHCGERPSSQPTPKNRIANQLSPLREFYVYKILEALEIPVQKTRLSQITYSRQKITRYGLLIEDIDATARRLGGEVIDTTMPVSNWAPGDDPAAMPKPPFRSAIESNVDLSLLARAFLGEALIGNYDWEVRVSPDHEAFQSIWNAQLISRSNKKSLIMPEDFDLPTILTGRADIAQGYIPDDPRYHNSESVFYNVALARITFAQTLFQPNILRRERQFIASKAQALEQVINSSQLDRQGKETFKQHVREFFRALSSLPN